MSVFFNLSTLAIRDLVLGTAGVGGLEYGLMAVSAVAEALHRRFVPEQNRLAQALLVANQRAWQTLELALAGDSFWQRCRSVWASADQKALRDELQAHIQSLRLPRQDAVHFCRCCLCELRAARQQGLLDGERLDPARLASHAARFAQFRQPDELFAAEREILRQVSATLRQGRYESLAELIESQPCSNESLLTAAVRYFFRRAVEEDPKLFQALAFAQLEKIQHHQTFQFDALRRLLAEQGGRIENLLGELQAELTATHHAILDVREEQRRQAGRHEELYQAVLQLQNRLDLVHQRLRPQDSLSIRGDVERRLVKQIVSRFRALPEDQRREMPALLHAMGMLQVAAGDFQEAQQDFVAVAASVTDREAQAEAHFNAYRAALEQRDWQGALQYLTHAVELDRSRFEPFPCRKYEPIRILGAGGFGVAFLCRHTRVDIPVVIKTLHAEDLGREVAEVFNEARVLRQIDHPNIIGLRDCDFADDQQTRPYLEMDFFPSVTLDEFVRTQGRVREIDFYDLGRQIAEGLRAAHDRGVLHRDVKPGNVLVRRDADGWRVKIIDFGLALSTARLSGSTASQTLRGSSLAGTLDYAAPEQMGRLPDVPVSPASDVYGFARTCFFALFGTPHPKAKHFETLSPPLRSLLDDCISEHPHERPADLTQVLRRWPGSQTVVAVPAAAASTGSRLWNQLVDQTKAWLGAAFAGHAQKPQTPADTQSVAPAHKPPSDAAPEVVPIVLEEVLDVLPASPVEALPVKEVNEAIPLHPKKTPKKKSP